MHGNVATAATKEYKSGSRQVPYLSDLDRVPTVLNRLR